MKWILPEQNLKLIPWLLKSRGISDLNQFALTDVNNLHSPLGLNGAEDAAKVIYDYAKSKRKIFIHGDFDVDGITATSIMWQFLYRDLNANVLPYIPSRFNEGYGLSEESITNIIEAGGELIITVDCGVKDIELVRKYSDKIKFVITDHHTILDYEPDIVGSKQIGNFMVSSSALAVVHPKLGDYPFTEICGAVVSWKVCSAINDFFKLGIDVNKYLDLAAIGTICDIMPLVNENRIIVKTGLKNLATTPNLGLKVIMNMLKLDPYKIDTYHIGFLIGPRLNASGRLDTALDAVRLLTTNDPSYAQSLFTKLNELNTKRQALTLEHINLAEEQIINQLQNKILFVYGDEWPEGIVGLIAGRLTEKYNRPVIAGSVKDGIFKASARSIENFHIAEHLSRNSDLLLAHGGHAQAAGLTLDIKNFEKLRANLINQAEESLSSVDFEKKLYIDGLITSEELNFDTIEQIGLLSPFGFGNRRPVIVFKNAQVSNSFTMGKDKNHIKLVLDNNGKTFEAVAFNRKPEDIKNIMSKDLLDLAGTIDIDEWNGNKKIVFKIEDFN